MATGQDRRRERLGERLRGAQRTNIEDDSFHLDIPGITIDPSPAPASTRRTPNTSAKRKRLDGDEVPPQRSAGSSARKWSPPPAKDPYGLPETSKESIAPVAADEGEPSPVEESNVVEDEVREEEPEAQAPIAPSPNDTISDHEVQEELPPTRPISRLSDEIEESPRDAPGTGRRQRRSIFTNYTLPSSSRLQSVLGEDDAEPPSSSPLAKKVRRDSIAPSTRSTRSIRQSPRLSTNDAVGRLSPASARDGNATGLEVSEVHPAEEVGGEGGQDPLTEMPEEPLADDEAEATDGDVAAEEIGAIEAAKAIGRKRPRRSPRRHSPELGGDDEEVAQEDPAPKRRRGRQADRSPAAQKQPASKPKAKAPARRSVAKATEKQASKAKAPQKARRESSRRQSAENNGPSIEVTVQRFVNIGKDSRSENEDDPISSEVPFSAGGETVVDVFAQVCREVIDSTIQQLHEATDNTEDKAKKKEFRIKMRAIEAYQEELNSKLLQHAIHLNDWQALRKRVRLAQKEKLSLREEIIRLRGEQEQVALRMDAVRIKHEGDTKESKYRLDTSATMHDIDLAVERGRDAPELSLREQKQAELANLELLVSRISDEASSNSAAGGMLKQVKDFNALLERAAIALETR